MRKKKIAIALLTVMMVSLSGCAENPDTSVVQNKNMDSMIEKAESTEETANNYEDVVEELEKTSNYKTEIADESLGVTVSVDADVVIPETDKLSVFRVSQKDISQEFLDKVRSELTPDVTYYDGNVLDIQTKADLAREIQLIEDNMAVVGKNGIPDQETADSYNEEYKQIISELEQQYESAPDKIGDLSLYLSDNTLHSAADNYNKNNGDAFYEWYYSLNPNGENYYGISDGKDGNYRSLFVQNNPDYGNCLRFQTSKNGYVFNTSVLVDDISLDQPATGKKKTETDETDINIIVHEEEEVTISEEEARTKADRLMNNLGLTDYAYCEGGLYFQMLDLRWKSIEDKQLEEEGYNYRKVYKFMYMRNIDGIFVDNRAGSKLVDEWQGDSYVKKLWGNEAVIVYVNDDGIAGFNYCSPISIDEQVVENASIQSFDEIKDVFERMVVIDNAATDGEKVSIDISSVELVYARISEKDNFDAGILVPIWDFKGKKIDEYGMETEGSVISINAIDGSVIDWELGY